MNAQAPDQNGSHQKPLHIKTPAILSTPLSKCAGLQVYLKLENLQVPGSFKIRGIGNLCQKASSFISILFSVIFFLETKWQTASYINCVYMSQSEFIMLVLFIFVVENDRLYPRAVRGWYVPQVEMEV